jgi:hypothetical protein
MEMHTPFTLPTSNILLDLFSFTWCVQVVYARPNIMVYMIMFMHAWISWITSGLCKIQHIQHTSKLLCCVLYMLGDNQLTMHIIVSQIPSFQGKEYRSHDRTVSLLSVALSATEGKVKISSESRPSLQFNTLTKCLLVICLLLAGSIYVDESERVLGQIPASEKGVTLTRALWN